MTERAMTMPHGTFVSGWRQIAFVSSDLHARNEMLAQVRETAEAIVNGILRGFTLQLVNFPQSRHFQPHFSLFFQTPLGTYIRNDLRIRMAAPSNNQYNKWDGPDQYNK